ncbi:MAG: hypothetical protein ACRC31_01070 [Cetobacterium sp.]
MFNKSDVLFDLWSKKVEPTLCKFRIDIRCSDAEMFQWWDILGKHHKKSKHGKIIEALNYVSCTRFRDLMANLSSSLNAKCKELRSKSEEAQISEAKIQDLQSQLDKLQAEQLTLNEKCKNHKSTISDLKLKLIAREFMPPKTLKSDGGKKHVHFLEEVTSSNKSRKISSDEACATAQERVPISVLKVMHNSTDICNKMHGVAAIEGHENPQTPGEHSKQPCGKNSRFCSSCYKIGHTEEKCWSLGRGRPPPYFLKQGKPLLKGKDHRFTCNKSSKTLNALTALFMQGIQLLTSFASGLAAQV